MRIAMKYLLIKLEVLDQNVTIWQIFYKKSAILENDVILTSDFWFLRIFLLLAPKRASGAKMVLLSGL